MYIKDNQLYTLRDLRRDHPHTSFPRTLSDELLQEYGLQRLVDHPPPYNPDYEVLINDGVVDGEVQYRVEMRPDISAYRLAFVRALKKLNLLDRVHRGLQEHPQFQLWWDHVTIFERGHPDMIFFDLIEIDIDEVFRELF